MKLLLAFAVVIFASIGIWLGGIRIIVVQPIGALPEGATIVAAGLGNVRLIDSPDAMCSRQQGGVSLLCRAAALGAIADSGKILLRLPYSETLFRITGGPFRDG
ncbi:hypothetical protein [Agrobacterium pusense]|uniref:hypothetical protein n=1 Tax=Agrobacterium pusense TaxID=648995 RepID=UPI00156AFFA9|nr:hypothetical protein [Agrobacterium pusense]QKJ90924.1 hypothetical protein HQN82_05945 [Agrobacterium pusense]